MISRSPVAEHDDFSGEPKNEARRTNNKAVCISNDSTLMSHKLLISTPYRRSPVTASIRHADCFWSSLAEPYRCQNPYQFSLLCAQRDKPVIVMDRQPEKGAYPLPVFIGPKLRHLK